MTRLTRALTSSARPAPAVLAALLFALSPTTAVAQEHGDHPVPDHGAMASHQEMPDGWLMRFDRSGATPDMAEFRVMEPGWHVTTGRAGAGIFWRPDMTASGPYRASATLHLFSPASHAEAFGLFIGGSQLDEADQEYVYFLVRQTGEYLIKRRTGSETANVVGWTRHDAIPVAPAGERGPTQYDLAIDVGADRVEFVVNGATVHSLPTSELDSDGVVGLRINHMLDVHVEELELKQG